MNFKRSSESSESSESLCLKKQALFMEQFTVILDIDVFRFFNDYNVFSKEIFPENNVDASNNKKNRHQNGPSDIKESGDK